MLYYTITYKLHILKIYHINFSKQAVTLASLQMNFFVVVFLSRLHLAKFCHKYEKLYFKFWFKICFKISKEGFFPWFIIYR